MCAHMPIYGLSEFAFSFKAIDVHIIIIETTVLPQA